MHINLIPKYKILDIPPQFIVEQWPSHERRKANIRFSTVAIPAAKHETHHGLPALPCGTKGAPAKLEDGIRLFIDP